MAVFTHLAVCPTVESTPGKIDKARAMEGKNPVASGKADKARAMKDLISLDDNAKETIPENVQESPKENLKNLTSLDLDFFETPSENKKGAGNLHYDSMVPSSDSNGSSQSQRIKSMHEAENKMQLELEELDQERLENNKLLDRKYLRSKQRCEVEKARIADEMSSGLENLDADTSPKRVHKPYAGRMDSWVQSSITNLNIQTSRVSDYWEVRSEVKGSGQDLENATKNFPRIPQDNTFENQKLGRAKNVGNEKSMVTGRARNSGQRSTGKKG
jgi:hypothetical protein